MLHRREIERIDKAPPVPPPVREVKGIVLAGVHDWGGCALDAVSPRPLLPVAGRPLITYALEWLRAAGLAELTVCSNLSSLHLREALAPHGNWDGQLEYYQDVMPRGPAGCMLDAWCASEWGTGLVMDGTVLPAFDLGAMLSAHEASKADMTVAASNEEEHEGQLDFFAPAGIYVFSRRALDLAPATGYGDLKETLIPQMYDRGMKVVMYRPEGPAPRVTGVESYLAVNHWLLESGWERPETLDGFMVMEGGIRVHPSARVGAGARLVGPVQVGAKCRIDDGATLIGPVCMGRDCRIHGGAVICRSVLWDDCQVTGESHLDRCVVTSGMNVGPRVRVRDRVLSPGNGQARSKVELGSP
ncbi:MAG: NDP-sugar synthase [Phycisphaerales bacterium]|nr:NDP-sugar synthase [Phycisphaerales bacterium]